MRKSDFFRWRKTSSLEYTIDDIIRKHTAYQMYVETHHEWKSILTLRNRADYTLNEDEMQLVCCGYCYWVSKLLIDLPLNVCKSLHSQGLKPDATLKEAKAFVETCVLMYWHEVEKFKEAMR